jgi:formylglycine-generating enzyme required for sulfatase activity
MAIPAAARRGAVAGKAAMAAACAIAGLLAAGGGVSADAAMVRVPAGSYVPLYRQPASADRPPPAAAQRRQVPAFEMDVYPVTNAEYLAFVLQHPEWRKSRAKALFVDQHYLRHWRGDLDPGPLAPPASPVVNVSWFAARAYLRVRHKTLPTVDQWEYVAAASEATRDAAREPAFLERLRSWYGRAVRVPLPPVGSGTRTVYGVRDLHGLVWEWTLDFNSALVTGESRGDSALDRTLYCGSGAVGAADFDNYPAFLRYGMRSSLEARYSVGSLGFRGVRNLKTARP